MEWRHHLPSFSRAAVKGALRLAPATSDPRFRAALAVVDAPGWPTPISSITCPYGSHSRAPAHRYRLFKLSNDANFRRRAP